MDHEYDKTPAISAQKMIESFEKTLKRFPSECDFNNQKTDLYGYLLHLAHSDICKEIFQETNSLYTTVNLLKELNYQSSYQDFVKTVGALREIKYELDDYLDDH